MISSNDGFHVPEARLHAFARGELAESTGAQVERHVAGCLACRVRLVRLRDAAIPVPSPTVLDALAATSPSVPVSLREASESDSSAIPREGELWRVGNAQAMLVWTRRMLEDSALVIPVVFEPELADQYSLIVREEASPLGVDLVLLTSVEGHVDLRAFLERFASLDVDDEIGRLREARREHRTPESDLDTGSPIEIPTDQRIEHQQLVADLLADLSPEAFDVSDSHEPEDFEFDDYRTHLAELSWRRNGALIEISPAERVGVDAAHELITLGRVVDLEASVLLTALVGLNPGLHLCSREAAEASGALLRTHHEANAVAISICDAGWTTVVVDAESTTTAIEPPTGVSSGPRVAVEPLPLVDALFKHFESQLTLPDDEETTNEMNEPVGIIGSSIESFAEAAIAKVIASGKRSSSPKKEVFTAFGPPEAEKVAELLRRVIASGRAADAIEDLLEGLTD